MSAGAILAALVFAAETPLWRSPLSRQAFRQLLRGDPGLEGIDPRVLMALALALLLPIGTVLMPAVFNWLVQRIALPFRDADAAPLPRIRGKSTVQGLFLTFGCWLLMGTSVWTLLQAVLPNPQPWSLDTWGRYTAYNALAYVAGFIILVVPSGLGIREWGRRFRGRIHGSRSWC